MPVGGDDTDGVMVEFATWPTLSVTWYRMAVAAPVKVASGVKVTTPVEGFTEYVPCPATTTVVSSQFGGDSAGDTAHKRTLDGTRLAPALAVSLARGVMVCGVLKAPELVLGAAVGAPTTVGVYVEENVRLRMSLAW